MIFSSALFAINVDFHTYKFWIPIDRIIAGICHGLVSVTVLVQASENSSKEFREMLVILIGAWTMLSVFLNGMFFSLCYPHEMSSQDIAILSFIFGVAALVANFFYTLETVPFLLKHNFKMEDSLYVLSQLKNEPMESPAVQYDFDNMKALYEADCAAFNDNKIFAERNRKAIYYGTYSRVIGMLSSSVPLFITIIRFFFYLILMQHNETFHQFIGTNRVNTTVGMPYNITTTIAPTVSIEVTKIDASGNFIDVKESGPADQLIKIQQAASNDENSTTTTTTTPTPSTTTTIATTATSIIDATIMPLTEWNYIDRIDPSKEDFLLYSVYAVFFVWFVLGFWTTILANRYNWKRYLYQITFIFGLILVCFVCSHILNLLLNFSAVFAALCLLGFFFILSWPLNLYGNVFLADGYPLNLNSGSIAFVSFIENGAHIMLIIFELSSKEGIFINPLIGGIIMSFLGYKLFRRSPNTKGLSLAEAREENDRALRMKTFGDVGAWEWIKNTFRH